MILWHAGVAGPHWTTWSGQPGIVLPLFAGALLYARGLLLLWERQVKKGAAQLRLAAADEPSSLYARQAKKLLAALVPNGTK